MHDDRPLVSAGSSANSAAIAVALQDNFAETSEMRFILPAKRVAGRTHAVRQDTLASAAAVHHPLSSLLHAFARGSDLALPIYR